MNLRTLLALVAAVVLIAPLSARAVPLSVTINGLALTGLLNTDPNNSTTNINGANLGTDPLGTLGGTPGEGIVWNLWPANPASDTSLAISLANLGTGFSFDQVIMGAGTLPIDITGPGPVSSSGSQPLVFVVGDTGNLSKTLTFNLTRNITVCNVAETSCLTQGVTQMATLTIGMYADTFAISESDQLGFDLGGLGLSGLGSTLFLKLAGAETMSVAEAGHFTFDSIGLSGNVPLPSTLALLGLGLFGFACRRRRKS